MEEIDWNKAKISHKPCPTCGVDILEHADTLSEVEQLESNLILKTAECEGLGSELLIIQRECIEANQKVLAMVAALEISPSAAVKLTPAQLGLIVKAVVEQAKKVTS